MWVFRWSWNPQKMSSSIYYRILWIFHWRFLNFYCHAICRRRRSRKRDCETTFDKSIFWRNSNSEIFYTGLNFFQIPFRLCYQCFHLLRLLRSRPAGFRSQFLSAPKWDILTYMYVFVKSKFSDNDGTGFPSFQENITPRFETRKYTFESNKKHCKISWLWFLEIDGFWF